MQLGKVIKKFKSKKGNTVVFRYPEQDDLDDMLAYANALIAEDTFVELSGKPLTREEEKKVLNDVIQKMDKGEKVTVVVEVNGHYSGSAELRIGQRRHAHIAEVGISLAQAVRGEGIGNELLMVLIEQAKVLKLRLLVLSCNEKNTHACHVYEKLGFKKAGIIPGAISYKNEYIGEVKFYLPLV
ncbi:GNAT family N-acetyltransferase [Candidatus Gottesmanbacteria bacterium]|nr:GNAT family N-acetyltransferase [Candidatus Gottesmanbacteria bacterium]